MTNTQDWSKFGEVEIEMARELLSHIKEIDSHGKVEIEFNDNSGKVFLVDSDYRVWLMNDDKIEEWFNCSYCGNEGFKEDLIENPCDESEDCKDFIKMLKGETK